MTAPRVLSLFSGIGGMDLGLERAGMTVVGQCEIDPYCRRVLAKHWPGVPCWDDVTTLTGEWIEQNCGRVDVIAGGFPCQDVSNAGLRAGISAPRSGLYRELVRCLRVVRPRFAILENVAALLGRGMGTVLGDLAESGYDADWDCVPACAVGAPHCRDRVFVAATDSERSQQSWKEPRRWEVGRVGRVEQSVPWNTPWESALCHFRGVDDGTAYGVERTDGIRNGVVPQVAEVVGRAVMEAYREETVWGIRNTATGAWCREEFATREQAEKYLAAQHHPEWTSQHQVVPRTREEGSRK